MCCGGRAFLHVRGGVGLEYTCREGLVKGKIVLLLLFFYFFLSSCRVWEEGEGRDKYMCEAMLGGAISCFKVGEYVLAWCAYVCSSFP